MSIRKDYTADVLRMLQDLKKEIEDSAGFLKLRMIDKDDLAFKIDKIAALFPKEMKDAASVAKETERILAAADEEATSTLTNAQDKQEQMITEAQEKANNIIEQARLQQEEMVSESEILRIAKAQSEEIRAEAEKTAREMKRGADTYAYDVLAKLESVVSNAHTTISRGKQELELNEMPTKAVVEPSRDKAEVK